MNDLELKGIYRILNNKTGHFYIGSTSLSFNRRFIQHKSDLKKQTHRNIHLQRAFNRDGFESFDFQILEILEDDKLIIEREQFYLDQKPHYNIATIAENSAKGRKATQEQRDYLSKVTKGRPAWNKGVPFCEETRQRMSISRKGKTPWNKGLKCRNYNPVQRSDGKVYSCPTNAALELNVKPNTIIKSITDKNKIRTVKGFTFKYLDKPIKEGV